MNMAKLTGPLAVLGTAFLLLVGSCRIVEERTAAQQVVLDDFARARVAAREWTQEQADEFTNARTSRVEVDWGGLLSLLAIATPFLGAGGVAIQRAAAARAAAQVNEARGPVKPMDPAEIAALRSLVAERLAAPKAVS